MMPHVIISQKKFFLFEIKNNVVIIAGTSNIASTMGYVSATAISKGSSSSPDSIVHKTEGIKIMVDKIVEDRESAQKNMMTRIPGIIVYAGKEIVVEKSSILVLILAK